MQLHALIHIRTRPTKPSNWMFKCCTHKKPQGCVFKHVQLCHCASDRHRQSAMSGKCAGWLPVFAVQQEAAPGENDCTSSNLQKQREGGGTLPPLCFDCVQQSTRWEHMVELWHGKPQPNLVLFVLFFPMFSISTLNLDSAKFISRWFISTIKVISVSSILAWMVFWLGMRAMYRFAGSHSSQGHKSPLWQLSLYCKLSEA